MCLIDSPPASHWPGHWVTVGAVTCADYFYELPCQRVNSRGELMSHFKAFSRNVDCGTVDPIIL